MQTNINEFIKRVEEAVKQEQSLMMPGALEGRRLLNERHVAPMRVFLDDKRHPEDIYPKEKDWIWVKTAWMAIQLLAIGDVVEISLDHDLGCEWDGNGYDVMKWIEREIREENFGEFTLPEIKFHSQNPVGVLKMRAALDSIYNFLEAKRYE